MLSQTEKINLLYDSFIDHMQLCRNTQYVGMMVSNATDYIETITLVFPALRHSIHNTKMMSARTFIFDKNFYFLQTQSAHATLTACMDYWTVLSYFHAQWLFFLVLLMINLMFGSEIG